MISALSFRTMEMPSALHSHLEYITKFFCNAYLLLDIFPSVSDRKCCKLFNFVS